MLHFTANLRPAWATWAHLRRPERIYKLGPLRDGYLLVLVRWTLVTCQQCWLTSRFRSRDHVLCDPPQHPPPVFLTSLLIKNTRAARGDLGSTCIHHTFISEYPSEISNNIKKNNDCTTWSSRTSNFHFKKSTNLLKISIRIHIYNTTY